MIQDSKKKIKPDQSAFTQSLLIGNKKKFGKLLESIRKYRKF